jgi:hypothetical protein
MIAAAHIITHPNIWDYWRFAIAFADIYIIVSGIVIGRYFIAYRVTRTRSIVAAKLPKHVWLMALSYLIFVMAGSFMDAYTRLGEGPSARLFAYALATILGINALKQLIGYEGRKYRKQTSYIYRPDFEREIGDTGLRRRQTD